jgi:hypothetical protein
MVYMPHPDMLEELPRGQMILSMPMKEIKLITQVLYADKIATQAANQTSQSDASANTNNSSPLSSGNKKKAGGDNTQVNDNSTSSLSSSSQASSQSSPSKHSSLSSSYKGMCPLHRVDPLYHCKDAKEQVLLYLLTHSLHTYSIINFTNNTTAKGLQPYSKVCLVIISI